MLRFQLRDSEIKITQPVEKFMTPDPFTLSTKDNVQKAIELMMDNKIGSCIIVDDQFRPQNIITKTDTIKLIFSGYTSLSIEDAIEFLGKDGKELITVKLDTPISECVKLFVTKNIKHLPVTDKKGVLKGIISATNILKKLSLLIFTDNLTSLGNRHYLQSIQFRLERIKSKHPIGILVADIDNFKQINDVYGHHIGDTVLQKVAQTILKTIRITDEAIRIGGEEFLIILFHASEISALKIAERIRKAVENLTFEEVPELRITISIGAVLCPCYILVDECIKTADKALLEAKETGKNKVIFIPPAKLSKPTDSTS